MEGPPPGAPVPTLSRLIPTEFGTPQLQLSDSGIPVCTLAAQRTLSGGRGTGSPSGVDHAEPEQVHTHTHTLTFLLSVSLSLLHPCKQFSSLSPLSFVVGIFCGG